MSQFSRKYYKNDYKLQESTTDSLDREYDNNTVWTFWRVWGLYEYLVLLLLGIIIFLLLYRVDTYTTTSQAEHYKPVTQKQATHTTPLQESDFAKKILPTNPLPQEISLKGEKLYGPLTMEEYLYFADDVNNFYPDFFDKKSRKSHAGSLCKDSGCLLTPDLLDTMRMAAYIQWLNDTSGSKYTFLIKENHYYMKKR